MATSRPSIPAVPSVVGTTDDSSRGGLFSRTNLANPISGADVNGVAIQDSTITIQINDNSQSFTLNQAADQTLEFRLTEGGGTDVNTTYTITLVGEVLTLVGSDGTSVPITLPSGGGAGNPLTTLNYATDTGILTATLMNGDQVMSNEIDVGVRTVNNNAPDANGNIDVALSASLLYAAGQANTIGTHDTTFNSLVVDANTGLELRADGDGIRLQRFTMRVPVDPGSTDTVTPPPPSVFSPATPTEIDIVLTDVMPVAPTDVTVMVTRDGNPITVTPDVTINPAGDDIDVVIPPADTDEPGDYEVTTTVDITPTDPDGNDDDIIVTEPFSRVIPFAVSRTELSAVSALAALRTATTEWTNTVTAPAGTGSLYLAIPQNDLDIDTRIAGNVGIYDQVINGLSGLGRFQTTSDVFNITDSAGMDIPYRLYRTQTIGVGTVISNLRLR